MSSLIAYARISGQRNDATTSLTTQLEIIRRWAAGAQHKIILELDEDHTGTVPLSERPKGAVAWAMLQSGKADGIVTITLDRLSRMRQFATAAMVDDILTGFKRQVHFCDTGQVRDVDAIEFIIGGWKSRNERNTIMERMQRGKIAKAQQRWVGVGRIPYGFDKVGLRKDAKLVINPKEAEIVRKIYQRTIDGHSQRAIAAWLNEKGLVTKEGAYWTHSQVGRIVTSSAVVGRFEMSGNVSYDPALRIIDDNMAATVREKLKQNKWHAKRSRKYEYLLSGHLFCWCGRRMSGLGRINDGKLYQYYLCPNFTEPRPYNPPCDNNRRRRIEKIDELVWNQVLKWAHPEALKLWIAEADKTPSDDKQDRHDADRIKRIDADIAKARREIKGAMMYADDERGEVAKQRQSIINDATARIESLQKERSEIEQRQKTTEADIVTRRDMAGRIAAIRGKLEHADYNMRRGVLDVIGLRAELVRVRGVVKLRISSGIGDPVTVPIK